MRDVLFHFMSAGSWWSTAFCQPLRSRNGVRGFLHTAMIVARHFEGLKVLLGGFWVRGVGCRKLHWW